ncbi:MAG: permease prefix domain 1-containing protein [Oscillospiraceae bacterium]|nr:permease prefix domain 1-containing protein [Oscillospiraceae bacterium]
MPERKTIQGYLAAVEEQIRWRRARPVVARELERHLEDQRDAFAAEGNSPEEAERLAVEEMGDPVAVGTELDRIHRPKPQWGLLALTMLLALAGGFLRVRLFAGWERYCLGSDPARTAAALGLGMACLLGAYFLDYTFLGRHAGAVYIAAVAAGLLSLWLSPNVNNASYYTRYVVLCYPVIYAVWLYACRGKGWKGMFLAISGGVPLALVCCGAPFTQALFLLLVSGLVLLLAAARMDWFGIGRLPTAAAPLGVALLMALGAYRCGFGASRIAAFLHPEMDPLGGGYQAMMNRTALAGAQWLGEGSMGDQYMRYPYEMIVPEADRSMLPLTVIYKLGWLPFLLLMLVFTALMVWLLCRCLRQKSRLGRLTALAVVMTLGLQAVFSVMLNFGFVLFYAELPLVVGNLHTVTDMGLIGLALSVFRGDAIARNAGPENAAVPLRISCNKWQNNQNHEKVLEISLVLKKW